MSKAIKIVSRTFRCPRSLSLEIDYLAYSSDRHVSEVIRDAIRWYLTVNKHDLFQDQSASEEKSNNRNKELEK